MRSITLKTSIAAASICVFAGSFALAQSSPEQEISAHKNAVGHHEPEAGFLPDPPSAEGVCPASGYSPPVYGTFGDNDGITQPYELASPCNSQDVRDVAEVLGMGRTRPMTVKNILTIGFSAEGTLAAPYGMGAGNKVTVGMNFLTDSVRLDVTAGGKRAVHVANDGVAWDETTPGVGYTPVAKNAVGERSPLLKLTPFGAWLSIVEAEGHAKMTKQGDKKVFTGTSPYDNIPVTVTVNALNHPEKVEVKANGHTYTAAFSGYSEKWEPGYWYIFPEKMVWTMDGKTIADLTVTAFKSNPYVVFPRPAELKAASN